MAPADSPHDKLFKAAFGAPAAMRGLLASVLPASIVQRLDLATLAPFPGSFVAPSLAAFHSDLLFTCRFAGRPAYVYVLVEHKSRGERWVALQLLGYSVAIWHRHLATHAGAERLPPIIPLVVSHDPLGGSAPRRLGDLLDPLATELAELARLTPHFDLVIDDLGRATDAELEGRAMGLFATLAAIFLRDARHPERVLPTLRRAARLLGELRDAPSGGHAVTLLLRCLCVVGDANADEVSEIVEQSLPDAKELIMTIAEQWEQRGMQKGLEQGLEQGREQGHRQALLATLRKQLELRFGPLDAADLARLEAADVDSLDRSAERVLTATTVNEVLGG